MNDEVFFDTNVLIYLVGMDEQRSPRAEALLARGGVVSVQVLNEFTAVARRKLGMSWEDVTEALFAIRTLCPNIVSITIETHEAALEVAAEYGYQIYDALIIASAFQAGCSTVYSEDLQDGQVIEERLTIRNPFREES